MSKHFHSDTSHTIHYIIKEITEGGKDFAETTHGIIINGDGTIFDVVYQMDFDSLTDWAEFSVNEDNTEYGEGMHHDESWC